jgi:hypothetical protein
MTQLHRTLIALLHRSSQRDAPVPVRQTGPAINMARTSRHLQQQQLHAQPIQAHVTVKAPPVQWTRTNSTTQTLLTLIEKAQPNHQRQHAENEASVMKRSHLAK